MKTYICVLRGINVSGKNLIKMAALKESFLKAGFKNIIIYIQSGNIVFTDGKSNEDALKKKIEDLILQDFGLKVPVLVRDIKYWKQVIENNPYLSLKDLDMKRLHVTFLDAEPDAGLVEKIKDFHSEADQFSISGKTIYLYTPGGYGNTKLNNNFFENKLKVVATTRNWNTVNELNRIADSIQ